MAIGERLELECREEHYRYRGRQDVEVAIVRWMSVVIVASLSEPARRRSTAVI